MFSSWIASIKRFGSELLQKARKWIIARTNPTKASQLLGTTSDLLRNKTELVAENALLRQQLIVLKRSIKQPKLTDRDRWWGVKRIRGELLNLGLPVSRSTIQKYWRQGHLPNRSSPNWSTFMHTQAKTIWACDFVQVMDVLFRSLFAFVIVELGSRRVVHFGVTRHPTDDWEAQQLREATPFGQGPKHLIRDNDSKYGVHFANVATEANIDVITTPYRTPGANAICERFIGSVRRECLDWQFIWNELHLHRVLRAYVEYFNTMRPHQGLNQRLPIMSSPILEPPVNDPVISRPILNGLHHSYSWAV